MLRWASFLAVILTLAVTAPAAVQFAQYTSPGSAGQVLESRRDLMAKAVEEARWHAGPLRLDPAFWISDLTWYQDPITDESDLTARAGAGLRGYLPVGSKTTVAAYALPEYVWWQEREDERGINQRFGVGVFTYFNRLGIEVTAVRDDNFGIQSGDLLQRTTQRTDRLGADLEIPVARWLSVYGSGYQSDIESLAEGDVLDAVYSQLDRSEQGYRGGLRFYFGEKLYVGGGLGSAEADFADEAVDRSNSGDFEYYEVGYRRTKLELSASIENGEFLAEQGSEFEGFEGTTGDVRIAWMPRDRFSLSLYGLRDIAYSLLVSIGDSFYVDERIGLSASLGLGSRTGLAVFYEDGSHSYEGGSGRVDDVASYGGDLSVALVGRLSLRVGFEHTEVDSPGELLDQELDELTASLGFAVGQGTWY